VSASSDEAFVLEVLAALEQTGLEALVVGSVAAVLQGSPVTTQDLDLLVRDTPANRQKIEMLGHCLGARPREVSSLTNVLRIDAASAPVDLLFGIRPEERVGRATGSWRSSGRTARGAGEVRSAGQGRLAGRRWRPGPAAPRTAPRFESS